MSDNSAYENDDLGAADEQQLVTLLDEFEQAIRQGHRPQIATFLSRVNDKLRPHLLADLIRLEDELSQRHPEPTIHPDKMQGSGEDSAVSVLSKVPHIGANTGDDTTALWDHSKIQVDVLTETQPSLVAETAELLRNRLRSGALIVVVGLGLFLTRALFLPESQLIWFRTVALVVAGVCLWRLNIERSQMVGYWRVLESVLILVVGIQTATLQVVDMTRAAISFDVVGVNMAMLFAFAVWSVAIMVYAILIPNNWQRAATILIPAAAVPLFVTLTLLNIDEHVAAFVQKDWLQAAALLTFVAAGSAVAATYTVHSLRKQLFNARRFGQYRLVKRLGRGGMGEVYLAEHQLLKRPSAIKLIRPGFDTDAEVVARFEREVQATAGLSHWNTVEIFDYGRTEDGTFYYVMEYLEGISLQQLVDEIGLLPPSRTVFFLQQICDALTEAHKAGLIHQDIKPANIFAARCGSRCDVAKLLDFGLVQEVVATEHSTNSSTLQTPKIVGTPRFMSPEQVQGTELPDIRSDVYSLGATAYYLLTGKPVFQKESVGELLRAHLQEEVVPPSRIVAEIPADLEAIVLKCLAKQPADRFTDAQQVAVALADCECFGNWSADAAAEWWQSRQPDE